MIVDFQHHFTPRELIKEDPGDRLILHYDAQGAPLRMGTHRQLGLPPCTFYTFTGGLPCPSCGMTTSFALLARGDVWNSLRANSVGTILALFGLVLLPWNVLCAVRGRTYFIASIEGALLKIVLAFVVLMLVRWAVVVAFYAAGWRN